MVDPVKVFVSYSWDVERDTEIVDELETKCKLRDIKLIRDSNTLQQGERISKFMERITGASHVIVVFSEKYFKSEYCLYELKELLQQKGFEQKVYPILVDNLKISDLETRRKFIKFWKTEAREEVLAIRNDVGVGVAPDQDKTVNLYNEFIIKVDGLMVLLGDILASQAETLKENQYASILDLIRPLHKIPPSAIFQPPESDQDFMAEIKVGLQDELDKSNTIRKAITAQIKAKGSDENSDKLADILIRRCENSLEELLRDEVHNAVDGALQALSSRPDNDSPLVIKKVQQLTSNADTLFSYLLLYAVREQWMEEYQKGCSLAASNLRLMPFGATAMVEIVTSRHLQRAPRFKLNNVKSEVMGEEGVAALEQGFDKDDIVTGILRQIWVKVFPMDAQENLNEKRLGAQIKTRHKRKGTKKSNYYLVVPDDENHPLADTVVRNELIRRLPELPLIILKSDNCADALVIPDDEELISIIFDFYLMLDEYIPYEPDQNR